MRPDAIKIMQEEMEMLERMSKTRPTINIIGEQSRQPGLKETNTSKIAKGYGVPFVHPLTLMTELADNCCWVDLCMKTIASACCSTTPLFRIKSSLTRTV